MIAQDIRDAAPFLELVDARHPASVTITIATSASPSDRERSRIALKDAVEEVEHRLADVPLGHGERDALLAALRAPLDDAEFWAAQDRGLLVLADPSGARWYRLPFDPGAESIVADRFDLRMLLRAAEPDARVFVLQLSRGLVRLTEVSAAGVTPRPLALPDDHDSVLDHADNDGRMDRDRARGSDGDQPERERFAKAVDQAVVAVIPRGAPLVLAAADDFRAAYRAQNTHAPLLDEEITAHPESLGDGDIAARSLAILHGLHGVAVSAWKERFGTLRAQGLATSRLSDVAAAAAAAAIEELRIDRDAERSGTVDEFGRLHGGGDGDFLLQDLAAQVLRSGGSVHAVPRDELTDGAPAAALLRFPVPQPAGG
ncbi:hypothetical protein [Microbacterium sp. 10M-3C3]|jgi:hypothetical protein|uniref:baeRF11 domain-containing protein n=1 Tax=Microbacterium sp. 10M-3C3 TaxID=2483401 RepID=UPI000F631105|nr:hypothetical protein [Microbacterium sp. 10M-3C3]